MSRIPDFTRRSKDPVRDTMVAASVGGVGAPDFRSGQLNFANVAHLGQTIEQLASRGSELIIKHEERKAADYSTKLSSEFISNVSSVINQNKLNASLNNNVDNFTESNLSALDNTYNKMLRQIPPPNKLAQDLLAQQIANYRTSITPQLMNFEATKRIEFQEKSLLNSFDQLTKTAAMSPDQLPFLLDQVREYSGLASATLGDIKADSLSAQANDRMVKFAINNTVSRDPIAADAMLEQYKDNLSAESFSYLQNSINNGLAKLQKQQASIETASFYADKIDAVLDPNNTAVTFDRYDKQFVKLVDDKLIEKLASGEDIIPYVNKWNYIPKFLSNGLSNQLQAGSVEQKISAASQITQMVHNDLNTNSFNTDVLTFSTSVTNKVNSGIDPKLAVQLTESEMNPTDLEFKSREQALRREAGKTLSTKLTPELIAEKSEFRWFSKNEIFGTPIDQVPAEVFNDYEQIYRAVYLSQPNMDNEDIVNLTMKRINDLYKKTSIGRSYLSKNVPETDPRNWDSEYGFSWMETQFNDLLKENGPYYINLDAGKQIDVAKHNVLVSRNKRQAKDGQPVYDLYYVDANNITTPLTVLNNEGILEGVSYVPNLDNFYKELETRKKAIFDDGVGELENKTEAEIHESILRAGGVI